MTEEKTQNPYHMMLRLPVEITSPDYYRLLGLEHFEDDTEAIRSAANDQNAELLKWQDWTNLSTEIVTYTAEPVCPLPDW